MLGAMTISTETHTKTGRAATATDAKQHEAHRAHRPIGPASVSAARAEQ
jgi:hypothetical protein